MRRVHAPIGRAKQPATRDDVPVSFDFSIPTMEDLATSLDPLIDNMLNQNESVKRMIPDTTLRLPHIRKEVDALLYASTALQKHIVARIAALHKQHNALIPFHNELPLELRVQIILQSLARKDPSTWEQSYKRLAELSTVCSFWWMLIKGSPELWTVIDPGNRLQAPRAVERSKSAPLHIHLDAISTISYGQSPLQTRLDLVTTHLYRCQTLDVEALNQNQLQACLHVLQSSAPALRTLQVEVKRPHSQLESLSINLDNAPNVAHLVSRGVLPTWKHHPAASALKVLALCSITMPSNAMIALLIQCSNLEELKLDATNLDPSANSFPLPISLPSLRRLKLLRLSWSSLQMMESIIQAGSSLKYVIVIATAPMDRKAPPPDYFVGLNGHNQPSLLANAIQNSTLDKLLIIFDFESNECSGIRGGDFAGGLVGFDITPWRLKWPGVLRAVSKLSQMSVQGLTIQVLATGTSSLQSIGNRLQELKQPVSLVLVPELSGLDATTVQELSCPNLAELWVTYRGLGSLWHLRHIRKAFDYDPDHLPFADPLAFKIRGREITSHPLAREWL